MSAMTDEDKAAFSFRVLRPDMTADRMQMIIALAKQTETMVPKYGQARDVSGFGPRERAQTARQAEIDKKIQRRNEMVKEIWAELVEQLEDARLTWPAAVELKVPRVTLDWLGYSRIVSIEHSEGSYSRPAGFTMNIGRFGDRTAFKLRKDGTWNWPKITDAFWGRYTANLQRDLREKKVQSIREGNVPLAKMVKEHCELSWHHPIDVQPSTTKPEHVLLRLNFGLELSTARAIEVIEMLKKAGIVA